MLDVQVSWLANQALNYFCSGAVPSHTGEYHPNLAPYQPFAAKDGQVIIAVGNDAQFQRLCEIMGCEELSEDPRFVTPPQRVVHRQELVGKLCEYTRKKTIREWTDCLATVQVPFGPIQNIAEVFEDPQVKARNMKLELEHPVLGKIPGVANPIKFSKTKQDYEKAPPLLGEDTLATLRRVLGKSSEEIRDLQARAVI